MEVKQARLANLRALIEREGAVSQLALRLQISPIYIYRVLDGKFNVGDSMARKIEEAYKRPVGWMDVLHKGAVSTRRAAKEVPTLTDTAIGSAKNVRAAPLEVDPTEFVIKRVLETLELELQRLVGSSNTKQKAKILLRAAERLLDTKNRRPEKKTERRAVRRMS